MIISTLDELTMHLPTHAMQSIARMMGFFESSTHDFLLEKVGKPLYRAIEEKYESTDIDLLLPHNAKHRSAWEQLIVLCQKPIVYDAFMRAAGISAVSINESGINIVSTDDYDNANEKSISTYKSTCRTEAHAGINRLLIQLEEWAQEFGTWEPEKEGDTPPDEAVIVELWRRSRYYYLADGLFINTATKFNEFVDIYESREKFIQMLPDIRYCQEMILRPELGDDLTDDLIKQYQTGQLNTEQKRAVVRLQRALALHVEARSKLFKRPEAKDEAIGNTKEAMEYIAAHQDAFGEAVKASPFYKKPQPVNPEPVNPAPKWENNRKGNALFITKPVE